MVRAVRLIVIFLWVFLAALAAADGIDARVLEDHTGSPVASAVVRLFRQGELRAVAELATGNDGRFRAPTLPAGEYRIEIAKPSFVSTTVRVSIEQDTPALTIRLVRGGVIGGRVTDQQGQPLSHAAILLLARPADGGVLRLQSNITATSDDRGEYRLTNLAPGQYAVAVNYGWGAMTRRQILTVSGGEEFRADFAVVSTGVYSVTGRVLLPGPRMHLLAALTPVDQPATAAATASPDDYGRLQFPRVPPGSYNLFVSGPPVGRSSNGASLDEERYYSRTHVDVAGQNVGGLIVEMPRGRTAEFRLDPAAGCPNTAQITLSPLEDWGANVERSFGIDSAKAIVVEDLAPTRFQMSVSQAGPCFQADAAIADLSGPAGPARFTVRVAMPGSLRGTLTGTSAAREFAVVLLSGDAMQVAIPGAGGRFAFDGLRPGHYRIAASDSRTRWVGDIGKMFDIDVSGGAPAELDLPAPRQ